jgi:hypothetical protein
VSALDRLVHITIFPDTHALTRESLFIPLRQFGDMLRTARAPTKQQLRLFSLCSYGDKRTAKNSLRHDANVRECFAVVGDYDGEKVPLTEAAEALHRAGIAAVLVTTPSHTKERPRWRVVAPLSDPLHRNRANAAGLTLSDYQKLVSRLAGIFPDNLAAESWTIAQSWYLGSSDSATDHQLIMLEGRRQ